MPLGTTSYLQIPTMAESDTGKYLILNSAIQQLEDSINRKLDLNFTSGNITLTESQFTRYGYFRATNVSVARDLTVPATVGTSPVVTTNRLFVVQNTGTATLTVKHPTGTTASVWAGKTAVIFADGTNVIEVSTTNKHRDLHYTFFGNPTSSQLIGLKVSARSIVFPANFSGSYGYCRVNPGAGYNIDVRDASGSIGTVTISAAGAFTFVTAGGTAKTLAAGGRLELVAPAGVDTTEDITIVFTGTI